MKRRNDLPTRLQPDKTKTNYRDTSLQVCRLPEGFMRMLRVHCAANDMTIRTFVVETLDAAMRDSNGAKK
jgi:hypothetical protein